MYHLVTDSGFLWISVIELFISPRMSFKYPKRSKNRLQRGHFWGHRNTLSRVNLIFEVKIYFLLCLTAIDEFSAASPLC